MDFVHPQYVGGPSCVSAVGCFKHHIVHQAQKAGVWNGSPGLAEPSVPSDGPVEAVGPLQGNQRSPGGDFGCAWLICFLDPSHIRESREPAVFQAGSLGSLL